MLLRAICPHSSWRYVRDHAYLISIIKWRDRMAWSTCICYLFIRCFLAPRSTHSPNSLAFSTTLFLRCWHQGCLYWSRSARPKRKKNESHTGRLRESKRKDSVQEEGQYSWGPLPLKNVPEMCRNAVWFLLNWKWIIKKHFPCISYFNDWWMRVTLEMIKMWWLLYDQIKLKIMSKTKMEGKTRWSRYNARGFEW